MYAFDGSSKMMPQYLSPQQLVTVVHRNKIAK